jgi:DNA-binding protein HU-beta
MIKLDIARAIAAAAEISQGRAVAAVDEVFACVRDALVEGERIEIRGFGVFFARPLTIARDPRTGQVTPIPRGRRTVRFKPGKHLQNLPCDPP